MLSSGSGERLKTKPCFRTSPHLDHDEAVWAEAAQWRTEEEARMGSGGPRPGETKS